jgi:hypothetical protein
MKKYILYLPLALLAACAPDIPNTTQPSDVIVVQFDPGAVVPVTPVPNDLAKDKSSGKLVIPGLPTDSAAQIEFNQNYLDMLNGFPQESTAQALLSGDLNPDSVTNQTVVALDLSAAAPVSIVPQYDASQKAVAIPPPVGGWLRGHEYAIAFVGGKNGLRGSHGQDVIGSQTWALVSTPTPLVTCSSSGQCELAVDIIPSSLTDPGQKLQDQISKAKQLEELRSGYAPVLDAFAATGINRDDIAIAWTFSIVDAGEVTFDPANQVIPFPNDLVRVNGLVNLPNPVTGQPLTPDECQSSTDPQIQLTCGLNTLDGFSTLAPLVSENSSALGAVMQAELDPASLSTAVVGLMALKSDAPGPEQTTVKYTPCLNCLSSLDANGNPQTSPQQLQWRLDAPLDEKTTYVAYLTTDARDTQGTSIAANPVFALLRSVAPLVQDAKSTVSILTDAQANQLEPIRLGMKPIFDALEAGGVQRSSLALAFAFTTQSEATLLDQLYTLPAATGISDQPTFVMDATATYMAIASANGIPLDAVDKIYVGAFLSPVAVTGPGGTLDPTHPRPLRVDFTMTVPKLAAPANGYPTTIFGHGITRSRDDCLAIANTLAKVGQVTIGSDMLFHGERSSCTGAKAALGLSTDDLVCAAANQICDEDPIIGQCVAKDDSTRNPCNPGGPSGDADCAAAAQGRCVPDASNPSTGKCQNADFLRTSPGAAPLISGWNIFSLSNFFATRDNFRQQVIDLSQLVRVIKGQTDSFGGVGPKLDSTRLGYVGQSLGGIEGTLFNAVSPDTTNVVLNVSGGLLSQILLISPSFAAQKKILLDTLTAQGISVGTPAFDQFIAATQWIIDPADPANMGQRLTHGVDIAAGVQAPNVNRRAFIQFIEGDQTVPNPLSFALVAAANRAFVLMPPNLGCTAPLFCYEFTQAGDGFDETTVPLADRHGFLLMPSTGSFGTALTAKAQTQVAQFLTTGAIQ